MGQQLKALTLAGMETFASFTVEGQQLYGMLHVPDADFLGQARPTHGWPSVVMLHGFTAQRSEQHRLFVLLSRALAARGVACLRFDFRGSGDSQGDFCEMTPSREVQDALAACEYARALPYLDPQRLTLLGFSLGAMVAALAAPQAKPHRLALWAPALPELWLPLLRGGHAPPVVQDYGGWPLGREFLLALPRLNPLKAAAQYGGVARVFHGDADTTCPPAWGLRYAQALGCDALAIPGAGHTFDSLVAVEQLLNATSDFILGR